MLLSYVEYRPNANTAILWNAGHVKGKSQKSGRVKEGS
jgi:hypothetical protein